MKKGSQQMMNTPGGEHGGQAGPEARAGCAGHPGTHTSAPPCLTQDPRTGREGGTLAWEADARESLGRGRCEEGRGRRAGQGRGPGSNPALSLLAA